jgi:hypothetical protein
MSYRRLSLGQQCKERQVRTQGTGSEAREPPGAHTRRLQRVGPRQTARGSHGLCPGGWPATLHGLRPAAQRQTQADKAGPGTPNQDLGQPVPGEYEGSPRPPRTLLRLAVPRVPLGVLPGG